MKGLKKLLTGILAATMIMGCTLNVSAQQTITITQDTTTYADDGTYEKANPKSTVQNYTWYRAMKATGATNPVGYYVDDVKDKNALAATNLFTITEGKQDDKTVWNVVLTDAKTTGETIAAKLYEQKDNFTASGTVTSTDAAKGFLVDDGYYLIVSELGSLLIADTAGRSATIAEKNQYPTIDKQQRDVTDNQTNFQNEGTDQTSAVDVKVGDTIEYKLVVQVPNHTNKPIVVTDTMSDGLVLVDGSIEVKKYGADTATTTVDEDKKGFTVNLPEREDTTANAPAFAESIITFSATVTADAIVDTGKKNEVTLQYGNYHQSDFVPYQFERTAAFKYDGALKNEDGTIKPEAKLAGVEFTLKVNGVALNVSKPEGKDYYVPDANGSSTVVTNKDGYIIIRGLDVDGTKTYTLTETKTLLGFNLPTGDAAIFGLDVVPDNSADYAPNLKTAELRKIENNKGTLLPSTGGMGTTIFYIIGSILIVAGVAYFMVRRKAAAK